jgi:hypothetical protein
MKFCVNLKTFFLEMVKMTKCIIGIICLMMTLHSYADTTEAPSTGLTILYLGVQQSGNLGFFTTAEAPASAGIRGCAAGLYYLDLSTAAGRAIYSTLLSAHMAGKKILRLDWSKPGNCMATIVVTKD